MIDKMMLFLNIYNYEFDVKDKILFINQSIPVKTLIQLKQCIYNLLVYKHIRINNIIINGGK